MLYPTHGLAYGQVVFPNWALAYAKAYNNWLHDKYLKASTRFQGVALIPMQDVPSAVAELKRAIKELGMVGAMIPSNGLRKHISAKEFWPVYEEAEKLDCVIAVHGGSYRDLGFDTFTVFPATRALGMPFPAGHSDDRYDCGWGIRSISQFEGWFLRGWDELDSPGNRQVGEGGGVWRA